MANHRKPASVHRIQGTYDASRHSGPEPEIEQGEPDKPEWLSGAASAEWDRVCKILIPAGYIAKSDGMALAAYAELSAEFASDPTEFPAAKLTQMRLLMGELGMTPASRAKMPVMPKPKANPYAALDDL